ncbi:Cilia- and flagella-associated protein 54, partial [Lonchura striata]
MDALPITWDFLCNTIWLPFYFASDMIIDMIIDLQASSSLKIVDHEGDFCIPSCLGGIVDENGGSNLYPQPPLDDVNVVDLRWICNLILKTIELLYQMKKWEALVHIAVQFNILTHERFTEQVSPLLVYAQRQLLERIQQFCGSNSHESHFTKYLSDDAQKVKCRFLFGVLTLNDVSITNVERGLEGEEREVGFGVPKRYITTSKMRLRTKYCYFSAILFKTLFRASLPHPTSDYDFVQYETNILIPGIDLFSDRYRADISTVVASLNFIMLELHCAKQNLIIKVLADIGFFTEAFHELSLLISGVRIPWKIPAGYRYTEKMQVNIRKALQKFDSSKSLMIATNLQVLEDTFKWSLSLTMVPLCNQQIMNKLILAKMHLIICLAATINNIPEKVEKNVYSVDNSLPEPSKTTASNVKVDADQGSRQQEQRDRMVRLVDCKDELNMAMLKGILLTEAEESLSYLVQDIQEKYDGDISRYSVEDLEALIEAKLELASISQQRHQAALSVALAFSAIRLLQDAKVFSVDIAHFQEEKNGRECLDSTTEGVPFPPRVTARGHVNVHLWLRCRAMLVTALVTQIYGVGGMKGNDVAERRSVIKEVILEAEAFGDIETQAEMMVQAAILDLQEKRPAADVKLLLQIFDCGESIEQQEDSTLTCLVLPIKNIYLPHINLLAQVKMKIGKVERQITETGNNKSSQAVETLLEAIKLSQQHDQKYELIRRSYLEIALLYLYFAENKEDESQTDESVPSKSSVCFLFFGQWPLQNRKYTFSGDGSSEEAMKSEVYKAQAWIAIRAATQVGPGSLSARDGHLGLISDTGIVLRIAEMHSFLEKNLFEYSLCCLENFPEELRDVEMPLSNATDSSEMSLDVSESVSEMSHVLRMPSPVSVVAEDEKTESRAARAPDKEINIQWYIPSMAKPSNDTEMKVLLLYAYNTNPVKISDISSTSVFSGHLWIPLARIISLREKLSDVKEQVEILMYGSNSFSASVPASSLVQNETLKRSRSNKSKRCDRKLHLDDKTEEIIKRCLSEVKALLSVVPALSSPLTEV